MHTVKNIFITSMSKRVLYLSPTYEGKAHDKTICDSSAKLTNHEEQIKFDISTGSITVFLSHFGKIWDFLDGY
jgi:uncharacterized protein YxjI